MNALKSCSANSGILRNFVRKAAPISAKLLKTSLPLSCRRKTKRAMWISKRDTSLTNMLLERLGVGRLVAAKAVRTR